MIIFFMSENMKKRIEKERIIFVKLKTDYFAFRLYKKDKDILIHLY